MESDVEHDTDDDVPARTAARNSRPPRLANDPLRYIRRIKGGRFQARPYDSVTQERRSLGTFGTVGEAREAIRKYWWGKLVPPPRYVKPLKYRTGEVRYIALVPLAGFFVRIGSPQATREAAARIVKQFLVNFYGGEVAEDMLRGKDNTLSVARRRERGLIA